MRPINQSENVKPKQKLITYRPLPESGMLMLKQWLQNEAWQELYQAENAHQKAQILQTGLLKKLDEYLPVKSLKIRYGDLAWISSEIKILDRKQKREYRKNKKSRKWNDLKTSNQSQWFSKVKRMSVYNFEKKKTQLYRN